MARPCPETLDQAVLTIEDDVYRATAIVDLLETAGLIDPVGQNWHSLRVRIAEYASSELRKCWIGSKS